MVVTWGKVDVLFRSPVQSPGVWTLQVWLASRAAPHRRHRGRVSAPAPGPGLADAAPVPSRWHFLRVGWTHSKRSTVVGRLHTWVTTTTSSFDVVLAADFHVLLRLTVAVHTWTLPSARIPGQGGGVDEPFLGELDGDLVRGRHPGVNVDTQDVLVDFDELVHFELHLEKEECQGRGRSSHGDDGPVRKPNPKLKKKERCRKT